jgi:hypothetical protein
MWTKQDLQINILDLYSICTASQHKMHFQMHFCLDNKNRIKILTLIPGLHLVAVSSHVVVNAYSEVAPSIDALGCDYPALLRIIRQGDYPAELAAISGNCWSCDWLFPELVREMIRNGRVMSVAFCLPELRFSTPFHRDHFFSSAVEVAIEHGNMDIADSLLAQDFGFNFMALSRTIWMPRLPWNLLETKQFIKRHLQHAAALKPTGDDFRLIQMVDQAVFLIELAMYCHEVGAESCKTKAFDSTSYLASLLHSSLSDDDMLLTARRLLDMGAQVEQTHLEYLRDDLEQTGQLLRQYQIIQLEGEIKNPGMD